MYNVCVLSHPKFSSFKICSRIQYKYCCQWRPLTCVLQSGLRSLGMILDFNSPNSNHCRGSIVMCCVSFIGPWWACAEQTLIKTASVLSPFHIAYLHRGIPLWQTLCSWYIWSTRDIASCVKENMWPWVTHSLGFPFLKSLFKENLSTVSN